jgi:hypothetical protein
MSRVAVKENCGMSLANVHDAHLAATLKCKVSLVHSSGARTATHTEPNYVGDNVGTVGQARTPKNVVAHIGRIISRFRCLLNTGV